ncbi:FAD-dependent oxidoreductase, partial [Methanocaldococcus infernus]
GSGAAGLTAASTLREYNEEMEIIVVTKDKYIAYSPCAIPYVIEGTIKSFEDIIMRTPEDYKKRGIDVLTETEAKDVKDNKVELSSGEKIEFDYLVLATGSSPFIPPIEGRELEGVFKVKSLEDGKKILEYMKNCEKVAIIGAGAIGLEMAYAFKKRGLDILVVEMAPQVLPRFLDPDMAEVIKNYLESLGIKFILSKPLEKILGKDKVEGILVDGQAYDVDMVILATGVRPNIELAKKAGCKIGKYGIEVDEYLRTSVKNIYAAGDCVEVIDMITGEKTLSPFGSTAVRQGRVVGKNIAGLKETFPPVLNAAISKIGELEVGGVGLTAVAANLKRIPINIGKVKALSRARYYPGGRELIIKLVAKDNLVVGGQIIGYERVAERIDLLSVAITKKVSVKELSIMEFCYAPPVKMVKEPISLAAEKILKQE